MYLSKTSDPEYQKMNVSCNSCCANVTGSNKNENECVNQEKKSLPYKEIEAIINNNRMIIRVQTDSLNQEEWDPPCDCNEENKKQTSQQKPTFNPSGNVILQKVDLNQCNQNPCRTITVYPHADQEIHQDQNTNKTKNKEFDSRININDVLDPEKKIHPQHSPISSIDLEENPNIFLLRIKKKCETGDGKYNIDLEFRAPRPWLPKTIAQKPTLPPVEVELESGSKERVEKRKKGKKGKPGKKGEK
ncbi:uncharacterized protein LOC117168364 isoform X2 [Belonocnema kinseyi]|uniref:uncharacterized protein LOC117168364 isoform X2 n=1 Tax=Belonocnema kinseyi TaxID=2817044 RepID=UPI00143D58AF|nr:uncharacterized protein LOC117168364 isoform X2 [Belonocnema kinseyi]